jgi:hypothetical protein
MDEAKRVDDMKEMAEYIPKIIETAECTKNYTFVDYLSHGKFGVTSTIKDVQGNVLVLKVQKLIDEKFLKEVQVMKRFSELNIGVNLTSHCFIENQKKIKYGVIIMEKVDGVLKDLFKQEQLPNKELDHIGQAFIQIIQIMQKEHISHNDLHFGNIGYTKDSSGHINLRLIDFGEGSDIRSFTDIAILSIGRNLMNTIYQNNTNVKYLLNNWWPKLKVMYLDTQLCNLPDDSESIVKTYRHLWYTWVGRKRFIDDNFESPKESQTSSFLSTIISNAPCTPKDYHTVNRPCDNGLCILKLKQKTDYISIKYAEISYNIQSQVLWEHESHLFQLYYQAFLKKPKQSFCKVTLSTRSIEPVGDLRLTDDGKKVYGIMFMDAIDGTLDQYFEKRQDDILESELEYIANEMDGILKLLYSSNITYGDLSFSHIGFIKTKSQKMPLRLFDFTKGSIYKKNTYLELLSLGKSVFSSQGKAYHYLQEIWWPKWIQTCPEMIEFCKMNDRNFQEEWKRVYELFAINRLIPSSDIKVMN